MSRFAKWRELPDGSLSQEEVRELLDELEGELAEKQASFDLRWKADMRAIKMWHDAGGDELTWPDHADLVVWLLERIDRDEKALRFYAEGSNYIVGADTTYGNGPGGQQIQEERVMRDGGHIAREALKREV